MEKIKRRTIRFSAPKPRRTALTAVLAGMVLALLAVSFCLMVIFIFS